MKKLTTAAIALLALGACGDGNPFVTETEGGGTTTVEATTSDIPENVQGALANFEFDPTANTLTVTGLVVDGNTVTQVFNRAAALDQGVYEAYSFQDDPLDEHTTVFVRRVGSVEGAVAATGGQFQYYSGGVTYKREGSFDPITPDATNSDGLVTYAGEYAGLTNVRGPDTDLLATPAGLDPAVLPRQSAPVTGNVLINVEFADNDVKGTVYNRVLSSNSAGLVNLPDLILVPSTLSTDGTFAGDVELNDRTAIGDYGGVIGGTDASELAGGLFVSNHFDGAGGFSGTEEEYGVFVLGRCGGPNGDPSTECSAVDPD